MTAMTSSFRGFAHEHDEIPAFHAAFLVSTILSAAVFNLGFFGLVILGHMTLDFVKYRDVHGLSVRMTLKAMLLESIGDIALFLLALTFAVYLNHTYLLSALSGMVRSELTILRAAGTLIPKVRIMENILAIALNWHSYMHTTHPALERPLSRLEKWSIRTIIVCTSMLVLAVILFHANEWDLIRVLEHELVPTF
jgi:hypothetical protein